MALTPAMEDYLEAILMIKQQHGYVRCVDVAEQLGVKKPSVSRAVKELSKSGHLVKNANGTLSLTEQGLPGFDELGGPECIAYFPWYRIVMTLFVRINRLFG